MKGGWVSGRWIGAPQPIYTGLAQEQEIRKQNPEYWVIEVVLRNNHFIRPVGLVSGVWTGPRGWVVPAP